MNDFNDFFFLSGLFEECRNIKEAAERAGLYYTWSLYITDGKRANVVSTLYLGTGCETKLEGACESYTEHSAIRAHLHRVWSIIEERKK